MCVKCGGVPDSPGPLAAPVPRAQNGGGGAGLNRVSDDPHPRTTICSSSPESDGFVGTGKRS